MGGDDSRSHKFGPGPQAVQLSRSSVPTLAELERFQVENTKEKSKSPEIDSFMNSLKYLDERTSIIWLKEYIVDDDTEEGMLHDVLELANEFIRGLRSGYMEYVFRRERQNALKSSFVQISVGLLPALKQDTNVNAEVVLTDALHHWIRHCRHLELLYVYLWNQFSNLSMSLREKAIAAAAASVNVDQFNVLVWFESYMRVHATKLNRQYNWSRHGVFATMRHLSEDLMLLRITANSDRCLRHIVDMLGRPIEYQPSFVPFPPGADLRRSDGFPVLPTLPEFTDIELCRSSFEDSGIQFDHLVKNDRDEDILPWRCDSCPSDLEELEDHYQEGDRDDSDEEASGQVSSKELPPIEVVSHPLQDL
jgi:hypothetical protein